MLWLFVGGPSLAAQTAPAPAVDLSGEWICEVSCPAGGIGHTARIVQDGSTLALTNEGGMKSDGRVAADAKSIEALQWGNVSATIADGGKRLLWANGTVWTRAFANVLAGAGHVDVYGIHFDVDKADIRPDSKSALDEVAALLTAQPALVLEVAGHTDGTGTKAHNLQLSQQRAAAVVAELVKSYGISAARLHAKGYGDTKPVAPNDSDSDRALNRRVELRRMQLGRPPAQ